MASEEDVQKVTEKLKEQAIEHKPSETTAKASEAAQIVAKMFGQFEIPEEQRGQYKRNFANCKRSLAEMTNIVLELNQFLILEID